MIGGKNAPSHNAKRLPRGSRFCYRVLLSATQGGDALLDGRVAHEQLAHGALAVDAERHHGTLHLRLGTAGKTLERGNHLVAAGQLGSTGGFAYMITVFVLEMVFGVLASIIVMWFSRQREFRADAGAAKLAGRDKMIAALERLSRGAEPQMEGSMMAFGINGKRSMSELFMSHPPIEQRIAALRG